MDLARLAAGEFGDFDWGILMAAYTQVDLAESHPVEASGLNTVVPGLFARAGSSVIRRAMLISTDFVFDGVNRDRPYSRDDRPNPQTVYGRTKLEGEAAFQESHPHAVVVRTSWVFGPNGSCFPRSIARKLVDGARLRVVNDQIGCPTSSVGLSRCLIELAESQVPPEVWNASGTEPMSWYDLAVHVGKLLGRESQISPIPTSEYPTLARRPAFSVLDCSETWEYASEIQFRLDELKDSIREFL